MNEDMQGCTFDSDSPYVDLAVEVFALLADPTRVRIVLALSVEEMAVNQLAEAVNKTPTAVSQHLAKLRWGRIVRARQEGTRAIYHLVDEHAHQLVTQAVFQAQHAVDDAPGHHRATGGSSATRP